MKLVIIAAIGTHHEIGYKNDLLWHIPADLRHFKKVTSGHAVIMGRRTFNSIGNKPLPNRRNIVVSAGTELNPEGIEQARSVEEALELVKNEQEVFVLGGETIYRQLLPQTSRMYLTYVHQSFRADTYFPEFDPKEWKETERTDIDDDTAAGVNYSFVTLDRI